MPLLPTGNPCKLPLRTPPLKTLHPSPHLVRIGPLQPLHLPLDEQALDPQQAIPVQMLPQPPLHLGHHGIEEPPGVKPLAVRVPGPLGKHLVDEAAPDQLLARDPPAGQQRVPGQARPHPLHKRDAARPLGHEPQARKRREQVRVRRRVDEVAVREQRRAHAHGRPVQRAHQHLGVRVPRPRVVQVARGEGARVELPRRLAGGGRGGLARRGHVGPRGEEPARPGDERDGGVGVCGDVVEQQRDAPVVLLGHGVELAGEVERDERDAVALCEGDVFFELGRGEGGHGWMLSDGGLFLRGVFG